jgi:hypothetical protein
MGTSPPRIEENRDRIIMQKRMLAGISWAKTMTTPAVRKKEIPRSPMPRTPPI